MQVLNKSEAENWLSLAGMQRDKRNDLGFRNGGNLTTTVPLPSKPYRIPYLANLLITGAYVEPFVESLLWITDWGVAGEVSNRVGYKMVYALRADDRPLIDAPAHRLDSTEEVVAQSLLVVPILLGWDAYFIPVTGKYFVFTSNDEFIDVVSNDHETHARFLAALKESWGGQER